MIPTSASAFSNVNTANSAYVETYEDTEQGQFKDGTYSGSGATFSSNSIIEAVANALDIPFTNTNSRIQGGHSHGGHGEHRGN